MTAKIYILPPPIQHKGNGAREAVIGIVERELGPGCDAVATADRLLLLLAERGFIVVPLPD